MLVSLSRRQQRIEVLAVVLAMAGILAFLVLAVTRVCVNGKKATDGDGATTVAPRPTQPVSPRGASPTTDAGGVAGTPSVAIIHEGRADRALDKGAGPIRPGKLQDSAGPEKDLCKAPAVRPTFSILQIENRKSEIENALWTVTAYCPCKECCGLRACGVTASGTRADHPLVAGPKEMPFGTVVAVPEYGVVKCEDRGGAIRGRRLDVLFPTHAEARAWGVRRLQCRMTNGE